MKNAFEIYDNTARTKAIAEIIEIPDAPTGIGIFAFSVGQTVTTTPTSQLKPGIQITITQRLKENGHCKYFAAGVWHTQQDLEKNL